MSTRERRMAYAQQVSVRNLKDKTSRLGVKRDVKEQTKAKMGRNKRLQETRENRAEKRREIHMKDRFV
jgi:hypothetical protein